MPKKVDLLEKIQRKPTPKNFTIRELDNIMIQCGCRKYSGGRGSSLAFMHPETGRIMTFDGPHPGNELYLYQVKKVIEFLKVIGEIQDI
jgi:hypothetical protein